MVSRGGSSPSYAFALVLAAAGAGCARRAPATAPEHASVEGQVGYQFLVEPSEAGALGPDHKLWSPQPTVELKPPLYPERALRGGAEPTTVAVRIVIDATGRVASVSDSPKLASTAGPFLADFRQAVEVAVRAWSFTPGHVLRLGAGRDVDGDGEPDYREALADEPVVVYYDVRFDFAIVEGRGRATGGGLGPP